MLMLAKNYEFRKQEIKESKKGNKYLVTTWLGEDEKTIDVMTEAHNNIELKKGERYDIVIDFNMYYKSLKIVDYQPVKK